MKKSLKGLIILLSVVFGLIITGGISFAIYVSDYYKALPHALEAASESEKVHVENEYISFGSESSKFGLIFYPGGKVQAESYGPLMEALSERGIFCILLKMPYNLAVFNINGAEGFVQKFPEIKEWYISGHSLGGSMACVYALKHMEELKGIVLLASFSTKDFSESGLKILSVYGSNDKVLGMESYEKNKVNYPASFNEFIIEGGVHSLFGSYGPQKGDGESDITEEEQILITADAIWRFVNRD